jgi:hypothetical protein
MNKQLRPQKPQFSYAESDSTNSPTKSEHSSFEETPVSSKTSVKPEEDVEDEEDEESSEDELIGDDNIIQGMFSSHHYKIRH